MMQFAFFFFFFLGLLVLSPELRTKSFFRSFETKIAPIGQVPSWLATHVSNRPQPVLHGTARGTIRNERV